MKLTTPATASVPYRADAPSFRISTRSTAISGTSEAVSTNKSPPSVGAAEATCRRLLSSTRVDCTPRPRRLMFSVPVVRFWVKASGLFCAPALMVSVWVMSRMVDAPICARSSEPSTEMGDGLSNWDLRRMKEPVTITSSNACLSSNSCAKALGAGSARLIATLAETSAVVVLSADERRIASPLDLVVFVGPPNILDIISRTSAASVFSGAAGSCQPDART